MASYMIVIVGILLFGARPVDASDSRVILYVFVPGIALIIVMATLWFWWECRHAGHVEERTEFDPYLDLNSKSSTSSSLSSPPMSMGRFIHQVPKIPQDIPQAMPVAHRVQKPAGLLPQIHYEYGPSWHHDFPGRPLSRQISAPESRSERPSRQQSHTRSRSLDTQISRKNNSGEPIPIRFRRIGDSRDQRRAYKNRGISLGSGHDGTGNGSKTRYREEKNSKRWMKQKGSQTKLIIPGLTQPTVKSLFPRTEAKQKQFVYPTSRDFQMEVTLDERDSCVNINQLRVELEEAFIPVYHHAQQSEADTTSTSISSLTPLKSCLKQRTSGGMLQRRRSKHVTFKTKSSLFKSSKKRKKSTKDSNRIKTVATIHANEENYVPNWISRRASENDNIIDGKSLYFDHQMCHHINVQQELGDPTVYKCNSSVNGLNQNQEMTSQRGSISGQRVGVLDSASIDISSICKMSTRESFSGQRVGVLDPASKDSGSGVVSSNTSMTALKEAHGEHPSFLGSYYSFDGDIYYSGFHVDQEFSGCMDSPRLD